MTEKVRNHPYSVVLLDEAEKAHQDIFNLMLQVFDDGYLTDSKGRKVDFRNTIIIMTSNLGATRLRDEKSVGFGAVDLKNDHEAVAAKIRETLKETFRPEFINRLDEAIVFESLTKQELHEIVKLMSRSVLQRVAEQGITIKMTPAAIDVVASAGFDPEYGAAQFDVHFRQVLKMHLVKNCYVVILPPKMPLQLVQRMAVLKLQRNHLKRRRQQLNSLNT